MAQAQAPLRSSPADLRVIRSGEENDDAVYRVLSLMSSLPHFDQHAFYPCAARLHLYSGAAGTCMGLPAWCVLFELLGWSSDDSGLWCDNVGELRVYSMGSAAQDARLTPGWAEWLQCASLQHARLVPPERWQWWIDKWRVEVAGDLYEQRRLADDDDSDGDGEGSERCEEVDDICNAADLSPVIRQVNIRGRVMDIEADPAWLLAHGVTPQHPTAVSKVEYLRALASVYKDELLSTEAELQQRLRTDEPLYKRLQLEEWYHYDAQRVVSFAQPVHGEESATFQALAQCVVDGSAAHYNALLAARLLPPPNTHWCNWPDAGWHK